MKITIDIDCTPQEARSFLGLPDVEVLNKQMMDAMQERIQKGFEPEELDKMMKMWMGTAGTNMNEMQKAFWSMLGQK